MSAGLPDFKSATKTDRDQTKTGCKGKAMKAFVDAGGEQGWMFRTEMLSTYIKFSFCLNCMINQRDNPSLFGVCGCHHDF